MKLINSKQSKKTKNKIPEAPIPPKIRFGGESLMFWRGKNYYDKLLNQIYKEK